MVPFRLIPISQKANNPGELMTGASRLIEPSRYEAVYPWQLWRSRALSLLLSSTRLCFKGLLFEPSPESNTGFLKSVLC